MIETSDTTIREPGPDSEFAAEALHATVEDLRSQVASLSKRLAELETLARPDSAAKAEAATASVSAVPAPASPVAAAAGISEEELLAISAALAAYLGVHAHIRQVRLIHTGAWAQQGRVTIQASHRLNHSA